MCLNESVRLEIGVIAAIPEIIQAASFGVLGRAIKDDLITIHEYPLQDFVGKSERIDDKPFGGGPGMIIKYAPIQAAIQAAKRQLGETTKVIYLSPQGAQLKQSSVIDLYNEHQKFILLCGRYEGIDQRVVADLVDLELSLGDYVISGGELAAAVLIDALARLVPGVIGKQSSVEQDSFSQNLLKYPQYTRPVEINGHSVPSVLLSGDHQAIAKWRYTKSTENTKIKRPDLLKRHLNEPQK